MKLLITGGAGFIGSNAARHFLDKGYDVTIFDSFSRRGSKSNIKWLKKNAQKQPKIFEGDLRFDQKKMQRLVKQVDVVLHLAAQVAVTTSVQNPREDFSINALGTFNLLEAIRLSGNKPIVLYSSTNKVYGGLEDIPVVEKKTRYMFKNLPYGVPETRTLDFHSPYGCSKGAADQYVKDYYRMYDIPTIVFRQSCIYGQRQFGIEDQGWVAWFIIALMQKKKITIFGNGKQVRDLLYVEDLIRLYELAIKNIKKTKGEVYNIGGGSKNTLSVWYEFVPLLEDLFGRKVNATFSKVRPGDQPIFIADIRKAKKDFGWAPQVKVADGITRLYSWVTSNKDLFI